MRVIVFTNDSNIVSVMIPALDCGLSLEEIAEKDVPVLDGQSRPYLIIDDSELPDRQYRDQWVIKDGAVVIDDQVTPPKFPDWEALYNRLLAGDLKPIFENIKEIAKTNLAINVDYTNIIEVFKIKAEQALKDCLDELVADGYVISDEYKALWNNAIAELNFSDLVKI